MDEMAVLGMLTDAGGTIDRICTVGLVVDCVQAREEAWRGDGQLARGLVAIGEMVRLIREDVQAVADWLDGQRDDMYSSNADGAVDVSDLRPMS